MFNFNYRKDKVNFFANYSLRYRNSPGFASSLQKYSEVDTTYRTDKILNFTRGGLNNSFRTGMEYSLNEKNTITGSFSYRISDGSNDRSTSFKDYNSLDDLYRKQLRMENEEEIVGRLLLREVKRRMR